MKWRPMTGEERRRVFLLCYNSKLGKGVGTADDGKFILEMFRMDPSGYAEVSDRASSKAVADYTAPYRALAAADGDKGGA